MLCGRSRTVNAIFEIPPQDHARSPDSAPETWGMLPWGNEMSADTGPIVLTETGNTIRGIGQQYVPFDVPLGLPLVNPLSWKQLQFRKEYLVTGVTMDEAVNGVLFGNYRPFMEVKEETYSRARRTRRLLFNPFTIELEHMGRGTGQIGESALRGTAALMGASLGLIEWKISLDARSTAGHMGFRYQTTNKLFSGHFYINVKAAPGGVILEDDWTTAGGADMRTNFLMMGNLVLLTHPKGFEHIGAAFVEEVKRARASGTPYVGEIGPPSIDEDR